MKPCRYSTKLVCAAAVICFPADGQSLPGDAIVANIVDELVALGSAQNANVPLGVTGDAQNPVMPSAGSQNPEGLGCEAQNC
jgi:hypothetical protein